MRSFSSFFKGGPKYALGHNTDAFDVGSSSDITITGAKVYNNDDCLAVNSGTNIAFNGNYCEGGHGISIVSGTFSNEHVF